MRKINDNSFKLKEPYTLKYDWPQDCFVQGGSNGVVCSKSKGNYETAYFEAFPKNPDCFIRGEGKDIEEAEKNAFEKFEKYSNCPNHEFEKVEGYKNGMGKCKHCGLMKVVFEPDYTCIVCNEHECFTSILKKYKKKESDCICEKCASKKENFKYMGNRTISSLANMYNGILFAYPVLDKETFDKLQTCPNSLEEFFEILSKDSNPYLEERVKRLQTFDETNWTRDEIYETLNDLYSYFYDNYIERWINKPFPNKKREDF